LKAAAIGYESQIEEAFVLQEGSIETEPLTLVSLKAMKRLTPLLMLEMQAK